MINKARAKMGRIKHWYGGKKGYGFVRPEDGGEAVFVHHTCMAPHAGPEYLEEGVRVSYEVASKKMCGLWAKNVHIIDQPVNVTTANRGETRV